jgi:hypothetical protein
MLALKDYSALLSAAAVLGGDDGYACQQYDYAAQSELMCNGSRAAMSVPSCKYSREDGLRQYYAPFLAFRRPAMRSPVE